MYSTCNSACVDTFTLTNTDQCDIYQRSEIPVRFILAVCNADFPSGTYDDLAHATAFAALVTNNQVSATPELAEVAWGDPTTTKAQFRPKSYPAKTITNGRQLTAKDYNATDKDSAGSSSPYEDRLFYVNSVQNPAVRVRGYITDQGRIYLFLNDSGNFMGYDMNYWTGWDQQIEGQSIEFKNYAIDFVGDPLKGMTTPYLDLSAADPTDSLNLGWMWKAN